ncbi:MAG TPA: ParB/RepB/Spo0J family partition protein [Solirubrobacterales bacterium]|nr:ParB/RepB/Spo0J family partition protein [Solirubrobacterales bacterium]
MSQLATPEVDIDLIDVVEDFNAREKFPREELEQLAGTINKTGLVQPIRVKAKPDGRFNLVAGERRLRAAKIAGRKKITLSTGNPYTETLVENIHRANLNPIETARGLKAFAEEHNPDTYKKIAAKLHKREDWVGAHLRLLKLPKSVQRYIAAGDVPMDAEPLLRPIRLSGFATHRRDLARPCQGQPQGDLRPDGPQGSQAPARRSGHPAPLHARPAWGA